MENSFSPMVDHFLSLDIKMELSKLESEKETLVRICEEVSVPCAVGEVAGGGGGTLFALSQKGISDHKEYISWLKANKPSFVAIVPKVARYTEEPSGVAIRLILKAADESGRGAEYRKVQESLDGECISYDVHAFFSGGQVRTDYNLGRGLELLCSTDQEEDIFDKEFEDDESYEDPWPQMSEEQVKEHALRLAKEEGFNIAKNQAERRHFAQKVFGDSIDGYEIDRIARESGPIYKMEVLPEKVRSLAESGNDPRKISELVGESLAKIKQIIAAM